MEGFLLFCMVGLGITLVIFLLSMIRQVNQYQAGVLFFMGKFSRVIGPGWHIIIPIFQQVKIVDLRLMTVEVEGQDTMTKDNVSVYINAVIYYKVVDPAKAIIDVQDIDWAVNQLAQTSMRNVVGATSLDELLSNRTMISTRIEENVEYTTSKWGVDIETVDVKDVKLPEGLKRTMAKVAEADREKRANILQSEGEVIAAKNFAQAAKTMSGHPGALHIRTLNSINDISSDDSNTVVFAVPVEILRAIDGFGKLAQAKTIGANVLKTQKKEDPTLL